MWTRLFTISKYTLILYVLQIWNCFDNNFNFQQVATRWSDMAHYEEYIHFMVTSYFHPCIPTRSDFKKKLHVLF